MDRRPAKILEQFNKKLEENGLEEEKINLKGLNGVDKEKKQSKLS